LRAIRVPDGRLGLSLAPSQSYDVYVGSGRGVTMHRPCKGLVVTGSSRLKEGSSSSNNFTNDLVGFCIDIGDKILSVNGISITELSVAAAVTLLDSSKNRLLLVMKESNTHIIHDSNGGDQEQSLKNIKTKVKKRKSDPSDAEHENENNNEGNENLESPSREYRRIRGKLVEHYLRKKQRPDLIMDPSLSQNADSKSKNNSSTVWSSLSRNYSKKYTGSLDIL
jgi:hypothetical protein